jgi:hypothetical protein
MVAGLELADCGRDWIGKAITHFWVTKSRVADWAIESQKVAMRSIFGVVGMVCFG